MNPGAERADTANVRHSTDAYFVRLDPEPQEGHAPPGGGSPGREGLGAPGLPRHRRRRRLNGRALFLTLVALGLGGWFAWASHRPGGASGAVNGWISSVRGDVAKVSADPDLGTARKYFNDSVLQDGLVPAAERLGPPGRRHRDRGHRQGCSAQAVVIQGASGGGTVSRLLLAGHDLGEVSGKYDCPTDLSPPHALEVSATAHDRRSGVAGTAGEEAGGEFGAGEHGLGEGFGRVGARAEASIDLGRVGGELLRNGSCTGRRNSTTASATATLNAPYCWPSNSRSTSAIELPVTAP